MQKFVYLVQEYGEPIGYNFEWNFYGPVSLELDQDITEAEALGTIKISWDDTIPIYSSLRSELSEFWQNKLNQVEVPRKIINQLPKTKKILENSISDPLVMETLASLTYLKRYDKNVHSVMRKLVKETNGRIAEKDIIKASYLLEQLSL